MHELIGAIEDIDIRDISPSSNLLRSVMENLDDLASSIKRIGLLQPIVVRVTQAKFEIIAGNRRFEACRKLKLKKIACHIVELDDKSAFEISLIENVQRHSLNPVEEAHAFKKYVLDFGWGGISELSKKIGKSPSYVSRRLKLVKLPQNILDLISQSVVNVASIEELLPIDNNNTQTVLTELIREEHLSSRMVRKIVKRVTSKNIGMDTIFSHVTNASSYEQLCKSFDKVIIALRIAIKKLARIIEKVEDNWIFYDMMMQHKHMLHNQLDLLIKQKIKYKKKHLHLRVT